MFFLPRLNFFEESGVPFGRGSSGGKIPPPIVNRANLVERIWVWAGETRSILVGNLSSTIDEIMITKIAENLFQTAPVSANRMHSEKISPEWVNKLWDSFRFNKLYQHILTTPYPTVKAISTKGSRKMFLIAIRLRSSGRIVFPEIVVRTGTQSVILSAPVTAALPQPAQGLLLSCAADDINDGRRNSRINGTVLLSWVAQLVVVVVVTDSLSSCPRSWWGSDFVVFQVLMVRISRMMGAMLLQTPRCVLLTGSGFFPPSCRIFFSAVV